MNKYSYLCLLVLFLIIIPFIVRMFLSQIRNRTFEQVGMAIYDFSKSQPKPQATKNISVTPKNPYPKNKKYRPPDIINIGTKKCGTGALQYFLLLHPNMTGSTYRENFFFSGNGWGSSNDIVNWDLSKNKVKKELKKILKNYMEMWPEIDYKKVGMQKLYEKTPIYAIQGSNPEKFLRVLPNARRKGEINEQNAVSDPLKLIFLACNPTDRALSDYYFSIREPKKDKFNPVGHRCLIDDKVGFAGNLTAFFDYAIEVFQVCLENDDICEELFGEIYFYKWLYGRIDRDHIGFIDQTSQTADASISPSKNHTKFQNLLTNMYGNQKILKCLLILSQGFYAATIKIWLKAFNREDLIILDGDQLISNLPKIMIKLEQDLNLPKFFKFEKFAKNENGFYCYDGRCVGDELKSKGTTRGKKSEVKRFDKLTEKRLREMYRPWNEKFYELIGERFDWD